MSASRDQFDPAGTDRADVAPRGADPGVTDLVRAHDTGPAADQCPREPPLAQLRRVADDQQSAAANFGEDADLDRPVSFFGSFYYYPQVQGNIYDPSAGVTYNEQYRFEKYEIGVDYNIPFDLFKKTGIFLEGGYIGDTGINKQFAPVNIQESGAFAGLGIHF